MKIIKVKDHTEMSKKACEILVEKLNNLKNPVFGLATGSTPNGLYQALIEKYEQKEATFQHATTFNLDEYVGIPKTNPKSYHYYMSERLFDHIDISSQLAHVPNGVADNLDAECRAYEQKISAAGGIDVQLLGLGANGHIGFNEPGTPFDSRTAVVNLANSTRESNARFFTSIDEVPKKAISMGIGTIMEAKEILLIVSGIEKATILANVLNNEVSENFPATILHRHDNVTIIADEAALTEI